ncbi:response regulator, partial [Vibrio parahaemolyticus V-223/04]
NAHQSDLASSGLGASTPNHL